MNGDGTSSEMETECTLMEQRVRGLLKELKVEYDKLIKLQCLRHKEKEDAMKNQNALKLWDAFESVWRHWDTLCFVEWLKRIKYQHLRGFHGYWRSDTECVRKIEDEGSD